MKRSSIRAGNVWQSYNMFRMSGGLTVWLRCPVCIKNAMLMELSNSLMTETGDTAPCNGCKPETLWNIISGFLGRVIRPDLHSNRLHFINLDIEKTAKMYFLLNIKASQLWVQRSALKFDSYLEIVVSAVHLVCCIKIVTNDHVEQLQGTVSWTCISLLQF